MTKTLQDYNDMGDHFDLDYLGTDPPPLTDERSLWRCRICRREFERSYRQLRRRKSEGRPGCRCRGRQALKRDDYKELARELGIRWIGPALPPTTRDKTAWKGSSGDVFRATYRELRYGVPDRLSQYFS